MNTMLAASPATRLRPMPHGDSRQLRGGRPTPRRSRSKSFTLASLQQPEPGENAAPSLSREPEEMHLPVGRWNSARFWQGKVSAFAAYFGCIGSPGKTARRLASQVHREAERQRTSPPRPPCPRHALRAGRRAYFCVFGIDVYRRHGQKCSGIRHDDVSSHLWPDR